MKKQTKLKAVIFDIGGVLEFGKYAKLLKRGHKTSGVHEYIANKFKITLDQWFDAIDTNYALSIEGKISKDKVTSVIAKNLNTTPEKLRKVVIKAYKKYFRHNKGLYKIAFKLKKQGYKIAILSDQWPLSKEALIKKSYANKFHAVVVSCDVGIRKPDIKIYKMVLRKLNLKAKECIFVDNQKWNMPPAKKLGMKTILFKHDKNVIDDLQKLGVSV